VRRTRSTLLAVAVVVCSAAFLAPPALAGKPAPFKLTDGSITETDAAGPCVWSGSITYTGKVSPHLSWTLKFRTTSSSYVLATGQVGSSGSFTFTDISIPASEFPSAPSYYIFEVWVTTGHGKNAGTHLRFTPQLYDTNGTGSCPNPITAYITYGDG
jgi:hypothetical protein